MIQDDALAWRVGVVRIAFRQFSLGTAKTPFPGVKVMWYKVRRIRAASQSKRKSPRADLGSVNRFVVRG